MKTLKPKRTADQETLRQLVKPLRLTDREWLAVENPLEANRLKVQYDKVSTEYAQLVNDMRREWEVLSDPDNKGTLESIPSTLDEVKTQVQRSDTIEIIQCLRLFNNLRWALGKNNKYLLNESPGAFPIMNYLLKEGPYMPPLDVQFGPEDEHIILEGDHKNLIYFQTRIDGLTKGRYVEYLG